MGEEVRELEMGVITWTYRNLQFVIKNNGHFPAHSLHDTYYLLQTFFRRYEITTVPGITSSVPTYIHITLAIMVKMSYLECNMSNYSVSCL